MGFRDWLHTLFRNRPSSPPTARREQKQQEDEEEEEIEELVALNII